MKAAWYDKQGPAKEVLVVGELPDPHPGPGEVRIRVAFSGVNPGDVKKRDDAFGFGMSWERVIPHSDGAGVVDEVGDDVPADWLGQKVWCHGAQSCRPFGTAAEYAVVPVSNVVLLPDGASLQQGACLGIPGITAHRCVHVAGPVSMGTTILVQGAAGAVGSCAVQMAHRAGARVIAAVRSEDQVPAAQDAGADEVIVVDDHMPERVRACSPPGVDHIVEVAFGSNIDVDIDLLAAGGSIAAYASDADAPCIPFWPLVFANIRLFFLGSDDFKPFEKTKAVRDLNAALKAGWAGFQIAETVPLTDVARAHDLVEHHAKPGRVLVAIESGA